MQTTNPNNLFQTTTELNSAEQRERKVKAAEHVGSPIKVSSKVLDLLVDGQLAWTAESGWQARRINLETGKTTMLYRGHKGPVTSVQLYRAGGQNPWLALITTSWDKSIRVWNADSGECRFTLLGHQDFVKSALVLPTTPVTLISTSSDRSCRIWDLSVLDDGKEPVTIQTIKEHTRPVDAAAYLLPEAATDDRLTVWTSDSLGRIKEWNMDRTFGSKSTPMTFVRDLSSHETSVGQLFPTDEGLWSGEAVYNPEQLTTVSMDKTAQFHSFDDRLSVTLPHPSYVKSILPQPFGLPYVLTGAEDEEIRVWDTASMTEPQCRPLTVVSGHCGEVTAIAPWTKAIDGKGVPHIVTGGLDGTVRRWSIQDLLQPRKLEYNPEMETTDVSLTEEEERELAELMSDDE